MTATENATAFVPGPGGFATAVQPRPAEIQNFPVPRPSAGLQLHGEYQGSGFTDPQYIARRGDGQVVQLSRLLYLVADATDGIRDTATISHHVSGSYGRELSQDNISFLIDEKLIPLGIVVPWDQEGDEVDAPRTDLLLALKGHKVLFDEQRAEAIGRTLAWLHRPPVVALVLLAAVAMDVWLFGFHGAITPVLAVLDQPVLMIVVFALTVASLVFHEFGHASACRYGGACPGCIGFGIFLVWPSMYTDVTDVYRIGRGGRIRTDLGGVYFNVVFILLLLGCYAATGQTFLLSAIYLGHFEVLEQLVPAVRLDGYYILGDLAGVPDLYGKIRPILLSMIPGRATPPQVAGLKRSTRIIVTTWVLTMVPLLLADLGYAVWNLPRILSTGGRSLTRQLAGTGEAFAHGQFAAGLAGVIGSAMLVIPLAGTAYLSVRLTGRLLRSARRATEHSRRLRIALTTAAVGAVGALCFAWVVGLTPKPMPPQPPLVPALQPGVPTVAPAPVAAHRSSGPGGKPKSASATPHSHGAGANSPSAAGGARQASATAVARPSATAPAAAGPPPPTTVATPTSTRGTGPTPSPAPKPAPSATGDPSPSSPATPSPPTGTARPSRTPDPHPSATATPESKSGPGRGRIQVRHQRDHTRSIDHDN
jgi:putative peptide zinc metalloprotease protein